MFHLMTDVIAKTVLIRKFGQMQKKKKKKNTIEYVMSILEQSCSLSVFHSSDTATAMLITRKLLVGVNRRNPPADNRSGAISLVQAQWIKSPVAHWQLSPSPLPKVRRNTT